MQIDHCMKQKAGKIGILYVSVICDMHSRKQASVHVSLNVPVSESSGTYCCVIGWLFPTFWETMVLSSSRVKQCKTPKPLALLTLEDEGSVFLWNMGNCSHSDVISHPRRCESSAFVLFERLLCTFCFLYCTVQNNWQHNVMISSSCLSLGNHI